MNRTVVSALTVAVWALTHAAAPQTPAATEPYAIAGIAYAPTAPLKTTEKPAWDPAHPPADGAVRTFGVTFAGGGDAIVPGDLSVPGAAGKKPAVLLLHGLGGDRKQLALLAALLNGKGYVTLSIDAAGHGSRPKIDGKGLGELNLAQMRTLGAQTVVDLRRATDYLAARPDVDPKRIGFLGVSLGGVLGARFLSDEPRIAAAVLWAAGGDWGKLLTTSQVDLAKRFRSQGIVDPAAIEKEMEAIDPARSIGHAAPRPLLFLHGTNDDIVPMACSDALYNAAPQPKERQLLPGGHIPNAFEMASRSVAWLEKRLKG